MTGHHTGEPDGSTTPAAGGALPALAPDRPTDTAGPIYEAELVHEPPAAPRARTWSNRIASWWLRSPRIPPWLKNSREAAQAGRDLAVTVVWFPARYLGAVARGMVVAVRCWRRWVTVRDYRQAAGQAEKLADKFTEIRALTLFRWKVTGAAMVAAAVIGMVAELLYGSAALWLGAAVLSIALAVLGRRKDGSPGRKAVLAGPRSLTWTMDPQVLVDAFRDAKLIGKDETLRLVERAMRVGDGWAITVDLPATRKATDVIKNREALASALAVDEVQLSVDRVRGNGGHAGRVAMWVADQDPYAAPPVRTPLLDAPRWDAWRPVPFGRDARNRRVDLPLVGRRCSSVRSRGRARRSRPGWRRPWRTGSCPATSPNTCWRWWVGWSSWSARCRAGSGGCASWTTPRARSPRSRRPCPVIPR